MPGLSLIVAQHLKRAVNAIPALIADVTLSCSTVQTVLLQLLRVSLGSCQGWHKASARLCRVLKHLQRRCFPAEHLHMVHLVQGPERCGLTPLRPHLKVQFGIKA